MKDSIFKIEEGVFFMRHTDLDRNLPILLFIHGLGESGLCFKEAFESPDMRNFTLIVPDMLGYGRSTEASDCDYCMNAQIRRLWKLVNGLGRESFFIIGHSLGGDLGSLMIASDTQQRIQGLVNIEGDLTPNDIFISNKIVSASKDEDFLKWFETKFKEELVLNGWGNKWASCRRYYASLQFARPDAVLSNAREIYQKSQPLPDRKVSLSGLTYAGLKIPKVFCWGSESLSNETLGFLEAFSLEHRKFEPAFHWPMIDQPQQFYPFLANYINTSIKGLISGVIKDG